MSNHISPTENQPVTTLCRMCEQGCGLKVWLGPDGLAMQDSTMAVVGLYEEGGFELSEDYRDLPDHVAAELEELQSEAAGVRAAASGTLRIDMPIVYGRKVILHRQGFSHERKSECRH